VNESFDYDAFYEGIGSGGPETASAATTENTEPAQPQTKKRAGQRAGKKHEAHAKFKLAHNFLVSGARHVSGTATKAWLILWTWSHDGVSSLDQERIATQMGMSLKSAKRAIRELENTGFLTVLLRGGSKLGPSGTRRICSTYQLHSTPVLRE
jgi:hypothetical protein